MCSYEADELHYTISTVSTFKVKLMYWLLLVIGISLKMFARDVIGFRGLRSLTIVPNGASLSNRETVVFIDSATPSKLY